MTGAQAVAALDALTPNSYEAKQKLSWLSRVEEALAGEVYHTSPGAVTMATELLAPAPYDELYLRYLQAQIFLEAGEITRYNNAMALFNNALAGARRAQIRENLHPDRPLTGL